MNRKRIYSSLADWRSDKELTQQDAAAILGIDQAYYSRQERGIQYPQRLLAKRISDKTGVALEHVLGVA